MSRPPHVPLVAQLPPVIPEGGVTAMVCFESVERRQRGMVTLSFTVQATGDMLQKRTPYFTRVRIRLPEAQALSLQAALAAALQRRRE